MPCKRFKFMPILAAEIALDDILAVLDGMNDLGELLLRQILGAHAGIDLGVGEDDLRVAGADPVNVTQGDVDPFVGGTSTR